MKPRSASNIQCHASAVMTVGTTHGRRRMPRTRRRAKSAWWSESAIRSPIMSLTVTDPTVNTALFQMTFRKTGSPVSST